MLTRNKTSEWVGGWGVEQNRSNQKMRRGGCRGPHAHLCGAASGPAGRCRWPFRRALMVLTFFKVFFGTKIDKSENICQDRLGTKLIGFLNNCQDRLGTGSQADHWTKEDVQELRRFIFLSIIIIIIIIDMYWSLSLSSGWIWNLLQCAGSFPSYHQRFSSLVNFRFDQNICKISVKCFCAHACNKLHQKLVVKIRTHWANKIHLRASCMSFYPEEPHVIYWHMEPAALF